MPAVLLTLLVVLLLWLAYEAAPGRVYLLAMAAERRFARLRDRRLEVAGHRIAFLDGGRGEETIVLLHGFGADRYHWPRFARHLTTRYRVLAPDLPGFGDSSYAPGERYDLSSQLERLHALLAALTPGPVHLVGNSMGGHLAAAFLRRYPDRVRSIALFDAAGVEPRAETPFLSALDEGENLLLASSPADFRRLTALMFVRQPFVPGRVLDHLGRVAAERRDRYERIFSQYREVWDNLEHGPALPAVPAMVLWGREDRVLPVEDVEVFATLLPHARIHVLERTGHLPMLERPAETARRYAAFLAEMSSGEAAPPRPPMTSTR